MSSFSLPFVARVLCFFVFVYTHAVVAAPAKHPKCVTVTSGTLSTFLRINNTNTFTHFSFNSHHELAYYPAQNKPAIQVEFQRCTPNYYGWVNDGTTLEDGFIKYFGRLYVPSLNKCIGVENAYDKHAKKYFPKAASCLHGSDIAGKKSIPQNFAYNENDDNKGLYWVGKSKTADSASWQGGCYLGLLGYLSKIGGQFDFPTGEPITGKNHRIAYTCNSGSPTGSTNAAGFIRE